MRRSESSSDSFDSTGQGGPWALQEDLTDPLIRSNHAVTLARVVAGRSLVPKGGGIMRGRCLAFALGSILVFWAAVSVAQTTGTIEGRVTDQGGGSLPGVTVETREPEPPGHPFGCHLRQRRVSLPDPAARGVHDYREPSRIGRDPENGHRHPRRDRDGQPVARALDDGGGDRHGGGASGRLDLDDDGHELRRQRHLTAASRSQLRRRRVHTARRPGGLRRDPGPVAGDLDLRIDLGGKPVPDRRRQHDQRHQGVPGQGHQHRVHPGSRGEDGRLPGRVRPQHGRHRQRHHEVGRQRVPRRRVRLLQRHRDASRPGQRRPRAVRHAELLRDRRRPVQQLHSLRGRPKGVGARPRRLHGEGQGLVFRRLRPRAGRPEPPDARPDEHGDLRISISRGASSSPSTRARSR